MSALGQKRTSLFNHFIGFSHQSWWHRETKPLCGFKVYDEIKLGRLQDGKITWLLAFQYSRDVSANLSVCIGNAWPITDQATLMSVYAELVNGGQTIFRREGNDATAPCIKIRIGGNHQCANLV